MKKDPVSLLLWAGMWMACLSTCTADRPTALHITVDAGSSGTRICEWSIQLPQSSNETCMARDNGHRCQKLDLALAQATPQTIQDLVAQLIQLQSQSIPEENVAVQILATGGFRQLDPQTRTRQIHQIQTRLQQAHPGWRIQVISGQTESRLAWQAVQRATGIAGHDLVMLESGGASVQLAWPSRQGQLELASFPVGMNRVLELLRSQAGVSACYAMDANRNTWDYGQCRALIERQLLSGLQKDPAFAAWQQWQSARGQSAPPVQAIGAAWQAVGQYIQSKQITLNDLASHGRSICAAGPEALMQKGIEARYARRACLLLSYTSALMSSFQIVAARISDQTWAAGAAVDPEYFPDCKTR
ncbi:MAG: hypothetical protein KDK39_09355 [Leptospiraceae bacterium]|nr:hypothetical protein [Leptospiraceae bacterium]